MKLLPLCIALLILTPCSHAQPRNDNVFVHDPCIAKEGQYYYAFSTGKGIPIRRSTDLVHWTKIGRVFAADVPDWARVAIPGSSSIWAPDISYFNGRFHLYYSVSQFGRNRSVIGLATSLTLDPAAKDYGWTDAGQVVASTRGDNFNAIDPNLVRVGPHQGALCFGSFWSGIKLIGLDFDTGKPKPGEPVIPIASRPSPGAIEAPFIIRHGQYFYLFVSFDLCCKGADSTYHIRVGRAAAATGPYVARDGKPMLEGGGTVVLQGQGNVVGPGHCAVLQDEKGDLLVHHFYDAEHHYVPTLQVRPLTWDADGWPVAGAPLR